MRRYSNFGTLSNVDETWTDSKGSLLKTNVTPFSLSTTNVMTPFNCTREIFISIGTIKGLCANSIPCDVLNILGLMGVVSGLAYCYKNNQENLN
jgi:hypothetical protein